MVSVGVDTHYNGVTLSFDASTLNDDGIRMVVAKTIKQINDARLSNNAPDNDICVVDSRYITVSVDSDTHCAVCTAPYLMIRIKRVSGHGPPRATVEEEGCSTPSALTQQLCDAANAVLARPS